MIWSRVGKFGLCCSAGVFTYHTVKKVSVAVSIQIDCPTMCGTELTQFGGYTDRTFTGFDEVWTRYRVLLSGGFTVTNTTKVMPLGLVDTG